MKISIQATIYRVHFNLVVNAGYVSVNLLLEATYNGCNLFLLAAFYEMLSRSSSKNTEHCFTLESLNYHDLLLPTIYNIGSSYAVFVMPTNCCLN